MDGPVCNIFVLIQPLAGFISFTVLLGIWLLDPSTLKYHQATTDNLDRFPVGCNHDGDFAGCRFNTGKSSSIQGNQALNIFITWFQNNFTYQSYLTERSSGMFQSLLDSMGEQWRWLIVLVYGIAQPVLPAIVGDPGAAWIMRIIGFLRAAGWYALALFLV